MRSPLQEEQIRQFFEDGYVVVPDLWMPEELEPLRQEIAAIIEKTAWRLKAEGRIQQVHEREGFATRLTRLMADHPELTPEYMRAIEGKAGGGHTGREMFRLITHPRLLDALEMLLGPEVVGSSVYRIRPKVPGYERGVIPWHQDSGYFSAHCDTSLIITCWIPLVDATPENGCLQVLPGLHRGGILPHRTGGPGGYLIIEESDLPLPSDQAVTVPVPCGGVLLMTNLTPHCSTPSRTDTIRWSVDLRYQALGAPTNAFQMPDDGLIGASDRIACYPPEGDFVVRSRAHPEMVHTYEQFVTRRTRYDAANLPPPDRGWLPVGGVQGSKESC